MNFPRRDDENPSWRCGACASNGILGSNNSCGTGLCNRERALVSAASPPSKHRTKSQNNRSFRGHTTHWLRGGFSFYKPMMIRFHKMHGLGNDFVVFDARRSPIALDDVSARAIADRRTGIGCDQVIVLERAKTRGDALMRIFNADGNEVEACGNAARCVARLLMEEKDYPFVGLDSAGGLLRCTDAGEARVTVDMGIPKLRWQEIPLSEAMDTNALVLAIDDIELDAAAVSVGNPHCIVFVADADAAPVSEIGPRLERHALFPERTNVEFVSVVHPEKIRMRVWERGVGVTRACGTGACASMVASARRGLGLRSCEVVLDGGTLFVEWNTSDDHIMLTGATNFVFVGEIDLAQLEAQ